MLMKDALKASGLQGYDTLDSEKAEGAANFLLNPIVMRTRMQVWRDKDMALFQSCCRKKELQIEPGQYRSADRLRLSGYAFATKEGKLFVPDEAKAAFASLDTPVFQKDRTQFSWVYDCMEIAGMLYGYLDVEELQSLVRLNKAFTYDCDEVIKTLLAEKYCPLVLRKGELQERHLAGTRSLEDLKIYHRDIARKYPLRQEIVTLANEGYPADVRQFIPVKQFLQEKLGIEKNKCDGYCEVIYKRMSAGATCEDIENELGFAMDDNTTAKFRNILGEAWLHSRLRLSNGALAYMAIPRRVRIFQLNKA